jgi:hypothetical protein
MSTDVSAEHTLPGHPFTAAEPCPCEGCRFAQRCASEQLACAAYQSYAQGAGKPRWSRAPRAPTRALYEATS